jgi:hypothetical protein
MRKYWIRTINYQIYCQIHQNILQSCRVDLERIPDRAVNDLKKFYIEQLNMSYNDVYFHIPQLKTYEAQQNEQRTIYQLNKHKIQEFKDRDEDHSGYSATLSKKIDRGIKEKDGKIK